MATREWKGRGAGQGQGVVPWACTEAWRQEEREREGTMGACPCAKEKEECLA